MKEGDEEDEIAIALNTRPKFVASRTLDKVTWNNSHLLKGDLIDALRIWQFPVVIGTGKRLFGEGTIPRPFRLVDTQQTATDAVLHVYERAGGLKYGEVEVGQEIVIFDADTAHHGVVGQRCTAEIKHPEEVPNSLTQRKRRHAFAPCTPIPSIPARE